MINFPLITYKPYNFRETKTMASVDSNKPIDMVDMKQFKLDKNNYFCRLTPLPGKFYTCSGCGISCTVAKSCGRCDCTMCQSCSSGRKGSEEHMNCLNFWDSHGHIPSG